VEVIAPSRSIFHGLRAIAAVGFDYPETKAIGEAAGWQLDEDEPELGYVWFGMPIPGTSASRPFLNVEVAGVGRRPRVLLPLFYYEDYENGRKVFDQAYESLLVQTADILGKPSRSGSYENRHRPRWSYNYAWWSFGNCTFALVQDEFDIQFGMDVSLWVLPGGVPFSMPVNGDG
jgi:hypothetical protein